MSDLVRQGDGVFDRAASGIVRAAVEGIGPLKGARDLVDPLRRKGLSTEQVVSRLVRTQSTHATVQGAAAGIGGLVTVLAGLLPATAAALFVQARLAAAIAYAHGHDLDAAHVRHRIHLLVSPGTAATTARKTGMDVGERAARSIAPRLQARAMHRVAARQASGKAAGRLTSRIAGGGASRAVPVVGAAVGGAVDLVMTRRIADRARREFGGPAAAVIRQE